MTTWNPFNVLFTKNSINVIPIFHPMIHRFCFPHLFIVDARNAFERIHSLMVRGSMVNEK